MKFKDLVNVMNAIVVNLGNQETIGQKKLFKIYEKLKPFLDTYKDNLEDIKLSHASVDEKGLLLKDEKNEYRYSKDDMRKMVVEFNSLASSEFEYQKINIVNPKGLEDYKFLNGWVEGIDFENDIEL